MNNTRPVVVFRGWQKRMVLLVFWVVSLVASAASEPAGPRELVMQTSQEMLEKLSSKHAELKEDPTLIYEYVQDIVAPHFDFRRMAQWVLGTHWRQASPEQQERFIHEFKTLLVRTYATALLDYTNQELVYLPLRMADSEKDVMVRTEIRPPGSFPIPVNYRMYRTKDSWKVYDVTIDNVSLVANYRRSFANEVRRSGLDNLIDRLAQRNESAQ